MIEALVHLDGLTKDELIVVEQYLAVLYEIGFSHVPRRPTSVSLERIEELHTEVDRQLAEMKRP